MENSKHVKTPRVNPVVRGISLLWYHIWKAIQKPRVNQLILEYVDDVPLLTLPEVLNAVIFRGGEFLAKTVKNHNCAELPVDKEVPLALDMGTGTGVGAIFACHRGYKVIGVDINPEAVRCARINVLINRLEEKIDIRYGDLFDSVSDKRFDLILFNPPFFRGEPKNLFDLAWRSTDVMERFAEGLPEMLTDNGKALVLLSTDGDAPGMLDALSQNNLKASSVTERHFGNEIMTIYSVSR